MKYSRWIEFQSSVPAALSGRGGGDSSGASMVASGEMGVVGAVFPSPSSLNLVRMYP